MYLATVPLVVLLVAGSAALLRGRFVWLWCVVALALGCRTYVRNLDYRTSEAIWTSVTENCAYNIRGWNSLAMTYSLAGNNEKALEVLQSALRIRPNDPDVFSSYGNVLTKLGKTKEAESYYRKAIGLNELSFDAHYNLGVLLLENGRPEESITCFEAAIKIRPTEHVAHYNLGKAYVAVKRLEEAVTEFKSLVKRDPKAPDARNNLGNALLDLNRADEALKILEEGLTFAPKDHELHRTLGLVLMSLGRAKEAIQHFETSIKLNDKDAKARADYGLALLNQGNVTEACKQFDAALAIPSGLEKDIARALNITAGDERLKLGQVERARSHYEAAVALDPNNPRLRYLFANLLLRTGAIPDSIRQYELIVEADPSFAEAHGEIGYAYMQTGRLKEARAHLETARRLQPDNDLFPQNLERLRILETP